MRESELGRAGGEKAERGADERPALPEAAAMAGVVVAAAE